MNLLIFLLGVIIGSFLNICIYRIPLKQSIMYPPSNCDNCNNKLGFIDLVPIIGFLLRRGKCKYCNQRISSQYPLVEILNGMLYLLIFMRFGFRLQSIEYFILSSMLIVVAIIDYKHKIIPNSINVFGFIMAFIIRIISFNGLTNLYQYLLGALIGGGFLLLIGILSKGGMGGGDIKLMFVLGLWLGLKPITVILFLSFFIGGFATSILVLFKLMNRKDMIAFGPFIVLATFVTMFYGNNIINYYINRFINY